MDSRFEPQVGIHEEIVVHDGHIDLFEVDLFSN
jgi:hypothetical protein